MTVQPQSSDWRDLPVDSDEYALALFYAVFRAVPVELIDQTYDIFERQDAKVAATSAVVRLHGFKLKNLQ